MSSINDTANITIRIDKVFKNKLDDLFENLGINMTTAIMMFLKQCDREQGLPFAATMEVPNKRLSTALEESEKIISGELPAKRYKNFDNLLEDIN